jgi:hypothetical protein
MTLRRAWLPFRTSPPPIARDMRARHKAALRTLLWVLALAAVLAGAACTRRRAIPDEAPEIRLAAAFNPSPPAVGAGQLTLSFVDSAGTPVGISSLEVKADMAHPGMTPWLAKIDSIEGTQVTLPVEWSMAGDWLLQIEAELSDGRRLRRTLPAAVEPEGPPSAD